MKRIAFVIPFYYKWNNVANVRSNYEYLQLEGYDVDIFSKKEMVGKIINWNSYDVIMLHGSGAVLPEEEFEKVKVPIISFGWSDPSLFNITHFSQGSLYCTNDLTLSKIPNDKPVYFYNTACDKRHHKNLNLEKETEILVYGAGTHKFVTDRNETVNKLREFGFNIKVFGRGWDKHPNTFEFIEGDGLAREICKAHLVLDISNETTAWPHRILESSACATPVLTIYREDTCRMFEREVEIIIYDGFAELQICLDFYLRDKSLLRRIGLNAQLRCWEDHDISVRIKELIKIMESL